MSLIDKGNLAALFFSAKEMKGRALKRVSLGTMHVTSGNIVACDPIVQPDGEPFARQVAPGSYAVEYVEGGSRPALLVLWLRKRQAINQAAITWEMALLAGQDAADLGEDEYYGYPVDAGWGCFMDADAGRAMAEREERAKAEDPDYDNYYEAFLAEETADCDAFVHCPSGEPEASNVMLCTSGWGDGYYPSYWALDKHGEPVALVTDFGVIANGDARSADEIAEEAYLASLSPEKLAALAALAAAIEAGDAETAAKLCASGLVNANDIIPSTGDSAILDAIRLDQQAVLAALLDGKPCPDVPSKLKPNPPDYFSYAARMGRFYQKKRKPRTPESIDILRQNAGLGETPGRQVSAASASALLASGDIRLVPAGELLTRYALYRLPGYASCHEQDPQALIAVCDGKLTLDHLDLDVAAPDAHPVAGFLITGQLTVRGNITGQNAKARSLVVLGDLHAGNLAIRDPALLVRGNAVVDGVWCGSGEGESCIDGDLVARLLIADRHRFVIGGTTRAPRVAPENAGAPVHWSQALKEPKGDIPIHFVLAEECLDDQAWPFNFAVFLERLQAGQPVLHPDCFEGSPKLATWRKRKDLFMDAEADYWRAHYEGAAMRYKEAEAAGCPTALCRYKRALSHLGDWEPKQAIPLFTWCIDNNAYLGDSLVKRAAAQIMLVRQGDQVDGKEACAAARADCVRVIEAAGCGRQRTLVDALNTLGDVLYQEDDYAAALIPLARALEIDRDHHEANSNMGKCLWHLDRETEALHYLGKAIETDPEDDYPYLLKAYCHLELEDHEAAAQSLFNYLERRPDSQSAREHLIRCLVVLDRLTDAQAQAFAMDERHPGHYLVNADGIMADALRDAGRLEDALKHAILSVQANPQPGHHFYLKGLCHYDLQDVDGALASWHALAEVEPDNVHVLSRLAVGYLSKNPETALSYLEKALALDPGFAPALKLRDVIVKTRPSLASRLRGWFSRQQP